MMNQFSEVKNSVKPTGHFLNRMLFILCFVCLVTLAAGIGAPVLAQQWQLQMSSDKSVYHVADTITYTIGGGGPVDHIDSGTVYLSSDIKNITWEDYWAPDWVTCSVSGNTVTCFEWAGPGWGFGGDPGLTISGTVTGGTKLESSCSFGGFSDPDGEYLTASASNTAEVVNVPPAPEFPSPLLPASMVIGFLGAVFYIKRTREK